MCSLGKLFFSVIFGSGYEKYGIKHVGTYVFGMLIYMTLMTNCKVYLILHFKTIGNELEFQFFMIIGSEYKKNQRA